MKNEEKYKEFDKISIIIPIYNVENFIEECIQSVIKQTYDNLEIICVNDCTNDNSIAIVEKFAKQDCRIKIIEHSKNKGLAPSRNTGLKAASGKYIYFLDSDDYLKENIIEKLYKKAQDTNSDVTIAKSIAFADNADNNFQIDKVKEINTYLDFESFEKLKVTIDNLCCCVESISCVAWNKLFRRDFLKNNSLEFINDNIVHEDNGFFIKFMSCLPVISAIDDIGVMYRIRDNSITSKNKHAKNKKRSNFNISVMDATEYIKRQNPKEAAKKIIKEISQTTIYANCFEKSLFNILKITWSKYSKRVMFFGLPLFRQKINNDKKLITIFLVFIKIKIAFKDLLPKEQFNLLCLKPKFKKMSEAIPAIEKADSAHINQPDSITKILNCLSEFYFLPNKGNLGDVVIAASEIQYFENQKYLYKIFDIENSKMKTPYNLVYGGGGIWNKLYKKHYKEILNIFNSKHLKNCVILPSSFYECDEVIKVFDNRFTVFCREKQSYEYCKKLNKKAKFLLADDMVVNANFNILPQKLTYDPDCEKTEIEKIITVEYPFYKKVYTKAQKSLCSIKEKRIGYFLRTDKESSIESTNKISKPIDLSSFGSYNCSNIRLNFMLTKIFLSVINEFEIVVTDRLHIAICAAKLKKEVFIADNSYKKLSSVYDFSLKKFENVHLISYETIEENIKQFKHKNIKNTEFSFDALPSNFNEFALLYNKTSLQ